MFFGCVFFPTSPQNCSSFFASASSCRPRFFPRCRVMALHLSLAGAMISERLCLACEQRFRPDPRTRKHQRFCAETSCQNARRAEAQRQRRARATAGSGATGEPRELKPREAAWLAQNSLFIGFVSHLIDSMDRAEVEAVCRRWISRGLEILPPASMSTASKCLKTKAPTRDAARP